MRSRNFLICVLLSLPSGARAGYAPMVLLSVEAPNPQVPSDCDPTYRNAMTQTIARQWQQCQQIGGSDSSYCQRELFDLCVRAARVTAAQAKRTCTEVSALGNEARGSGGPVSSQVTGDRASGNVNNSGAAKTRAYLKLLQANKSAFDQLQKVQSRAIGTHFCKASARAGLYGRLEQGLEGTEGAAATFVNDLSTVKQRGLEQLERLEADVSARGDKLGGQDSAPPSAPNYSPVPAATNFSPRMEPLMKASLGAAKLMGYGADGQNPVGRSGGNAPDPSFFQRDPGGGEWIQGGTGLGALATPLVRSEPARAEDRKDWRWETGNVLADDQPVLQPIDMAGAAPGSALFRELQLKVDQAFLDSELYTIEGAIKMMPECTRPMLQRGVFAVVEMREANSAGRCHYGQMRMGGGDGAYWVKLNPFHACGGKPLTPDMVVHELYHVVGFSNQECLLKQFQRKLTQLLGGTPQGAEDKNVHCPVSPYGATSVKEDFAQTGVQTHFRDGGVDGNVNQAFCANAKRQLFQDVVGKCSCGP